MNHENYSTEDEELQKLLEEVAKQEGFLENHIGITSERSRTVGCVGIMYAGIVLNKRQPKQVLHVIAKLAPKNDILRALISASDLFKREIYMYETIFPKFQQIEKENNLTPSAFIPKVFKLNNKEKPEALIMENLCTIGFVLHDSTIAMDKNHINMVFSTYGRFHALSFALREKNPECFNKFVDTMEEELITNVLFKFNFTDILLTNAKEVLQLLKPNLSTEHYNVFEKLVQDIPSTVQEMFFFVDEHSVIVHGDSHINNIMFKYQKGLSDNYPIDIKLMDFQLCRVASPVIDLSHLFYIACSKEALENLESYLHVYYNSFSTHLRNLKCCAEKLFPFTTLKQHWKRCARYGLLRSITGLKIILSNEQEHKDFNELFNSGQPVHNAFIHTISNIELYKMRIESVVKHFLINEYL